MKTNLTNISPLKLGIYELKNYDEVVYCYANVIRNHDLQRCTKLGIVLYDYYPMFFVQVFSFYVVHFTVI
jgi:hypothetical protein